MTWNVNFKVADGQVDPDSITVGGTPPDGPMQISGYTTPEGGQNLGCTIGDGSYVGGFVKPVKSEDGS